MNPAPSILLVDDDAEDRMIIQEAFNDIGHGTILDFAENGEEAIRYLQACSKQLPSLIVLDLNMPRMNGRQTLECLKAEGPFANIPVIIFSTSLNQLEYDQCLALGAHSYLIKPTTYREAQEVVVYFHKMCNPSL